MSYYFYYFIIFTLVFVIINKNLTSLRILTHDIKLESHKKFGVDKVPLSGGIFFFLVLSYLILNFEFLSIKFLIFIFIFFILGLIVDFNFKIDPKIRFLLQIILSILLVMFTKLIVIKTNIFFLDYLLKNYFFSILFSFFCITVVLNGINFLDGVNNNVIGLCILIFLTISLIDYNNDNFISTFLIILLISFFVFYIFNIFNKSYLGDAGVYVLSILISIVVILFINKSDFVSPFLALNLLWYPAYETLFSIIRKLSKKKSPFKPDSQHLHTLILRFLKSYKFRFSNSLSGFLINLSLIPNFIIGINFYNNSKVLLTSTFFYILIYNFIYLKLRNYLLINYKN